MIAYSLIAAALVVAVGAVGYGSTSYIANSLESVTNTQLSVRRQLEADMMHDSIRADVFAALIAARDGHADREPEISNDLAEHVARMKKTMSENATLPLGDSVGKQIAKVSPYIASYSARAITIIKDAFHKSVRSG